MNYTSITLGELLSSENETIKRNAISILKVLQKTRDERKPHKCVNCGENTLIGVKISITYNHGITSRQQ
jgi:hypothetical protein